DGDHILGNAVDRHFARPNQGRKSPLTVAIGRAVGLHLLVRKPAQDAARQHDLDEHVLIENQSFPLRGPQCAELSIASVREIVPPAGVGDSLIVGDRLYLFGMATSAVEAKGCAPVVQDQRDIPGQLHRLEPSVHVIRLIDEAIGPRRGFARPAHPDEVRRQAAADRTDMGNDIPPLVGPCGVAVQEDGRVSLPRINVADLGVENLDAAPRKMVGSLRLSRAGDRLSAREAWCPHPRDNTASDQPAEAAACKDRYLPRIELDVRTAQFRTGSHQKPPGRTQAPARVTFHSSSMSVPELRITFAIGQKRWRSVLTFSSSPSLAFVVTLMMRRIFGNGTSISSINWTPRRSKFASASI